MIAASEAKCGSAFIRKFHLKWLSLLGASSVFFIIEKSYAALRPLLIANNLAYAQAAEPHLSATANVQSTVPDECRSTGVYFLSGKRIIRSRCALLVAFRPHRSRKNRTVRAHHSGRSSENFEFLCARGSGKDFNKNIRFCDEIKKTPACD